MTEDVGWGVGRRGKGFEDELIVKLKGIFKRDIENEIHQVWYDMLDNHVTVSGVGRLMPGMGYDTFNTWMNGDRRSKRDIAGHTIKAMVNFVQVYNGKDCNTCPCVANLKSA